MNKKRNAIKIYNEPNVYRRLAMREPRGIANDYRQNV